MPPSVVRLNNYQRDYYLRHGVLRVSETTLPMPAAESSSNDMAILADHMRTVAPSGENAHSSYFIRPPSEVNDWPRVELSRSELLTPRLIAQVHAAACDVEGRYGIEICDALGYLESPFNVFVERHTIYVYASDTKVVEALRLDGDQFDYSEWFTDSLYS